MAYSPSSAIALNSFGAPTGNISMASHKFTNLLDGSVALDSAGFDQLTYTGTQYAYVAAGCVWTADSPGSTLNASMTAGTVVIGGLSYSVAAVTARAFTANVETYVDINISAGAAVLNYTTAPNWGISPALVSSGTVFNTVRIAVVSSAATFITSNTRIAPNIGGFGQGGGGGSMVNAGTQPSSTVAAGSNGSNITATPLNVASSATFISTGGLANVAHASGQTYLIKYTGTGAGTLTGVTVLSGSGTVSTGDTVTGFCPINISDNIGNPIYPTSPYPKVIAAEALQTSLTSTLTTAFPVNQLVTPFVIPAGPTRVLRLSTFLNFFGSSATAGTNITVQIYADNATTLFGGCINKVPVASDSGLSNFFTGVAGIAAGTYYAQTWLTQGAAGTLSYGTIVGLSLFQVELVG